MVNLHLYRYTIVMHSFGDYGRSIYTARAEDGDYFRVDELQPVINQLEIEVAALKGEIDLLKNKTCTKTKFV